MVKRLLVTGGAGFIGSEFVRVAVDKGYSVIVLDKLSYAGDLKRLGDVEGKIVFYNIDICDKEGVERVFVDEKVDLVVHFAAESHVDRSIDDAGPFVDSNVKGTQVLLDAAKRFGVEKFVNVATDEVYGDLGESGSFTEETALNPSSPYSASKAAADMLGRAYFRTFGVPVVTVRPSNNYGPWQYPEKLLPVVVLKGVAGEKVPVYGKGVNVREWLFVSDCAEAVLVVLERGVAGSVYNIGSGEERMNIDVVKEILKKVSKSEELIEFVEDRKGHDFRYALDASKIYDELGWKAKVGFEEGLERTVSWYLDNMEWVKSKEK